MSDKNKSPQSKDGEQMFKKILGDVLSWSTIEFLKWLLKQIINAIK